LALFAASAARAQTFTVAVKDTILPAPISDTSYLANGYTKAKTYTLLDTLNNPSLLRFYFFKNERISGQKFIPLQKQFNRLVPGVKQIQLKEKVNHSWKFWIIIVLIISVSLARLVNLKIFNLVVLRAFNFSDADTPFAEKTSAVILINFLLHTVFSSALALFIVIYEESRQIISVQNSLTQFVYILMLIQLVYLGKYLVSLIINYALKFNHTTKMFFNNAIAVNNIAGLLLVPVLLVFTYSVSALIKDSAFIVAIIIILFSVVFRTIKNLFDGFKQNGYPFIYIFIYLCATEIFPWLLIFKLLINEIQA